jgi:hypothetical protein
MPRLRNILLFLHRLHRDDGGAIATEYLMIMVFVVMPIGLMFPIFMKMVKTYGVRMTSMMGLPFP